MTNVNRRNFLKGSVTAISARPLHAAAAQDVAALGVTARHGIIDTHVYLSHWPARRVSGDETAELVDLLRKAGVTQAWAGSFDALLHKNMAGLNSRLAAQCSRHGPGLLIPFGAINPKLPDWEEDVRRCHEQFRMPGIRVHPNYHDYKLADPAFLRLLQLAAERKLVVQIAAWMEDERCPNPLLRVPAVDLESLPALLERVPKVKVMILNALVHVSASGQLTQRLRRFQVAFDFAMLDGLMELQNLIAAAGMENVMFGSYSPLFYIESALLKVREAALHEVQNNAVFSENARHLLALATSSKS
jgi:predicted TIM-barrel fold metal-dependent hydrolase